MYEQAIQGTQKTPAAAAARLECVSKEHRQEMDRRALAALVLKRNVCRLLQSVQFVQKMPRESVLPVGLPPLKELTESVISNGVPVHT